MEQCCALCHLVSSAFAGCVKRYPLYIYLLEVSVWHLFRCIGFDSVLFSRLASHNSLFVKGQRSISLPNVLVVELFMAIIRSVRSRNSSVLLACGCESCRSVWSRLEVRVGWQQQSYLVVLGGKCPFPLLLPLISECCSLSSSDSGPSKGR